MADRPHLVAVGEGGEAPPQRGSAPEPPEEPRRILGILLVAALALCALGWASTAIEQRGLRAELEAVVQERDAARARLAGAREEARALAGDAGSLAERLEALEARLGPEGGPAPEPTPAP